MKKRRSTSGYGPACALALLAALLIYLPSLWGGFLSDDLFLNLLGRPQGHQIQPDWQRILADITGPWVGMKGTPLFRPMLSLSYGWDMALGRGAPWAFHLTNLLCILGSLLALARILAYLGLRDWRILLPLLFLALHPAGIEGVYWISGRVSSMELLFRLLALWAAARYFQKQSPARLISLVLLAFADLLTKESAFVLPFWLFALDLFQRPDLPIGQRLRFHLRFVPIWLVYTVWRVVALGTLLPQGHGAQAQALPLSHYLLTLPSKLETLFLPGLRGQPFSLSLAALALLVLLVTRPWPRRGLQAFSILAFLILLEALPSFALPVAPNLLGSRLVLGALPLLAPLLLPRPGGTPIFRLRLGAGVALLGVLLWVQVQRVYAYQKAFAVVRRVHEDISRLGAGASPEHPLAILSTPSSLDGVPILNPNAVFPLAEQPFQETDIPLVGLNFVTTRFDGSEDLYLDARPIRAMGRFGARLLEWNGEGLVPVRVPPIPKRPVLRREGGGLLRIEGDPLSPFQIARLDLRFSQGGRGGSTPRRLSWLGPDLKEPAGGESPWAGVPLPFGAKVLVDLTPSIPFLAFGRASSVAGFKIKAKEPLASARLAVRPRPIPLSRRLRGAAITLDNLQEWVSPLVAGKRMALVVLGPGAGWRIPCKPGKRIHLGAKRVLFERILKITRVRLFYYYFVAEGARSEVDWFSLKPAGE